MALVLWSGGCDSTLVLYKHAVVASKHEPVRALSFVHPNVYAAEESRKARAKILANLRGRGLHVQHAEIEMKVTGDFGLSNGNGIQACLWVSLGTLYLRANEDLCLGYIRGDDVWHARESVVRMFQEVAARTNRTGQILFPLEWTRKFEVLQELRDARLLGLTWWCENPKNGKACRKCVPCWTHEAAEWQRKNRRAECED